MPLCWAGLHQKPLMEIWGTDIWEGILWLECPRCGWRKFGDTYHHLNRVPNWVHHPDLLRRMVAAQKRIQENE